MRIVIACGGSGGHIFPAMALAQGIKTKDKNIDIIFVGSNKALDRRIFEKEGFRYSMLSANKLPYNPSLGTFIFFIKLFLDLLKSLCILIKFRPNVAVGFGGYVAAPVIIAACILGIPRVVHEQNVVPGRANAKLFTLADRIAISFEDTKRYLGQYVYKAVFTGNPIRAALLKDDRAGNMKKLGLDADKFTILVIGGSQGAHNLNKAFLQALSQLDANTRSRLQAIHITGITDYGWAGAAYKELALEHRVYSFVDRIEEVYSAADLVVTRSGASAIFEIAYFGKPMVLIPYPFAMSHQVENARIFSEKGAAIQIDEKDMSPDLIRNSLMDLLKDRKRLNEMAESAKRLSMPDSSYTLAEEILRLVKGRLA